MPTQTIITPAVLPVFVLEKWVPDGSTVYDICFAAEKVTGPGSIDGATCIKGLWRVYPMNEVARIKILTKGISMGNRLVRFEGVNPFSRGDGVESSGTRLWISNLPFSYSNEAVARNLTAAGLKLRSKITFEKARGPDGMLSDWRTGKRSVWIDMPKQEVSRHCKMVDFSAFLYHKEMKDSVTCRRCLQKGHMARDCPNDEICLDCKKPGHRRGHPDCEISQDESIWGQPRGSEASVENAADLYVWGNPGNILNEKVADDDMKDDDGSEKSIEVSTAVDSNVSSEDEGDDNVVERNEIKNQECDEFVSTGNEIIAEHESKEADASVEDGIGKATNDEATYDESGKKLTEENELKSLSTSENVSGGNARDVSVTEEKDRTDEKTTAKKGNDVVKPDKNTAETPKTNKKSKRKQKQKGSSQPSIDKFVKGKRQIGDVSSPGDGKSGSPEEKSQKTTSA